MDITISQAEIGRRIRAARKKKGLTQKDVWEGLFSSGKYSMIERGTVNLSDEDLQAICVRLGISKKELLPDEPDMEKVKSNIMMALFNIQNGLFRAAYSTLQAVSNDVSKTPSIQQYYRFAWAELYLNQEKYNEAISYLNEIIIKMPMSLLDQETKVRAFNALAYISYKKLNVREAADFSDQAINFLMTVNAEFKRERAITFYNTAIFHCYLKNFEYARNWINEAIRYCEPEDLNSFKLLSAIIEIKAGLNSRNIKKTLEDLANSFFRNKDVLNWTNVLQCQYFIYRKENASISDFLVKVGTKIADEIDTTIKDSNQIQKETIQALLKLSQIAYLEKDFNNARRFVMLALSLSEDTKHTDDLLWSQIYTMLSYIAKHLLKDSKQEEQLIDKALQHLDNYEYSLERAALLYEKACITNKIKSNDIVSEAARIYNHSHYEISDSNFLTSSLPSPKY